MKVVDTVKVVDTEQRKGLWKWEKEILRGRCNGETTQEDHSDTV